MKKSILALSLALLATSAIAQTVTLSQKAVHFAIAPNIAASSHAAGAALGSLQTVPFFRASPTGSSQPPSSFSGVISNLKWTWRTGTNLTAITVYIFNANPTASTCNDGAAISIGAADVPKIIAGSPFAMTPAVVGNGSTFSTVSLTPNLSVQNADAVQGQALYFCIASNAIITPAANDGLLSIAGNIN